MDQSTKLEQLFLWKMSDELKLSIKEEKSLNETIIQFNKKRQVLSDQIQDQIKKMTTTKGARALERAANEYKVLLKKQADVNIEEFDRVKKSLGLERAVQFIQVKNELSGKIKGLLLNSEQKENK